MEITITLNGKTMTRSISPDTLLIDFVRSEHCLSVKRGCDTSNCGLCTVLLDNKPVLSCSVLAARAAGHEFIADQGAEQCGFCNPGFMMNTIALLEENKDPSDDEIRAFLSGNLCRCSGYEGQLRGIRNYINYCKENGKEVLG